jgi:hypothetical protein
VKVPFSSGVHVTVMVSFVDMNCTVTEALPVAASLLRVPVAVMFPPSVTVGLVVLKSVIDEAYYTVKLPVDVRLFFTMSTALAAYCTTAPACCWGMVALQVMLLTAMGSVVTFIQSSTVYFRVALSSSVEFVSYDISVSLVGYALPGLVRGISVPPKVVFTRKSIVPEPTSPIKTKW